MTEIKKKRLKKVHENYFFYSQRGKADLNPPAVDMFIFPWGRANSYLNPEPSLGLEPSGP